MEKDNQKLKKDTKQDAIVSCLVIEKNGTIMAKIKVMALGGLDERGKNLYLIEINENIFIFDCGLKLPEREMLGIDVIIPDFSYLKENKNRIKAIFITKPSDDVFGALPYLLKDLTRDKEAKTKVAIYSSSLTKFMIEQKLKHFRFINPATIDFNIVDTKQRITFPELNIFIDAFKTTTSIPGSLGFALHSRNAVLKQGEREYSDETIVYTGDYIFDGKDNNDFTTQTSRIAEIRNTNKNKQVLLLISEAQSALRKDFTSPNHKIQSLLEQSVKDAPGRIIMACYDQDLFRISEILQAIKETRSLRQLAIHGQTLNEILKLISENKVNIKGFDVTFNKDDTNPNLIKIISLKEAASAKDTVIIVTGTGERLFAKMNKIATHNDESLILDKTDTVILATPPIPGNEVAHASVLDELARTDATTISISEKQAWNLNASYEDIKLLTNMLNPKYFLPVKGLYKDLNAARNAAIDAGVLHNNALIHDNGEMMIFTNGTLTENNTRQPELPQKFNNDRRRIMNNFTKPKTNANEIVVGDVFVDGIGIGDIGAVVLDERRKLMSDGVLITGLTIDRKTKEIISLIDAQMRGVVYLTNSEAMLKSIQNIIIGVVEKQKNNNVFNGNEVKNKIRLELQDFIKKETGKMPMILPVINEI